MIPMVSALLLTWTGLAHAQEPEPKVSLPHITVSGFASEDAKPDVAVLTLGSTDDNTVAAVAVATNATHAQAIIAELKKDEIDAADIKTEAATLSPIMAEERDAKSPNLISKRTLIGYRASISFVVKVHQLDKVGALVGRIVERGADDYRGLTFLVTDQDARIDRLRAKAVANAMSRAALYAHGASMKLGRLLAINPEPDPNDMGFADLPMRRAMRSDVVPLPVEPGTQELSAKVTATRELVPE